MIGTAQVRLIVLLAGVLLVAGCVSYPSAGHHQVQFDGSVERTNDSFRMEGQVDVVDGAAPTRNFSDVRVVLYDRNQSVIDEVPLGQMSTDPSVAPMERQVNISSDRVPTYVLVESPDFWDGNLPVVAYKWTGERYEQYAINSKEDRFQSE